MNRETSSLISIETIEKEVLEIIEEIVDKDTLWRIMNTLRKKVILLSMEDDRDSLMKIKEVLEMAIGKEGRKWKN
jgi:hypothetical protein